MEEFLKTARAIHRGVVTVAMTILLFGLSSDSYSRYITALASLRLFDEVSSKEPDYWSFVQSRHPQQKQMASCFENVSSSTGIALSEGFGAKIAVLEPDVPDGEWRDTHNGMKRVWTVRSLDAFMSSPRHDARSLELDISECRRRIMSAFTKIHEATTSETGKPRLESADVNYLRDSAQAELRLYFRAGTASGTQQNMEAEPELVSCRAIELSDTGFDDWLSQREESGATYKRLNKQALSVGLA